MRTHILIALLCGILPLSCTALVDFNENATPEDCANGMDDDDDGHADCDDQDCWNLPACNGLFEICGNSLDDDGDGAADCDDSDCAGDPSCIVDYQFCNTIAGDPSMWMYSEVYPDSPGGVCPEMMECRIDLWWSDGVPRCVWTESFASMGEPCNNDLECRFGLVCTTSERMNAELARNVCLPLCSGILNIGCPADMECFRHLLDIRDEFQTGGSLNVSVFTCDRPACQVLGLNPANCGVQETCYPNEDMLGDGHCASFGNGGQDEGCDWESDCLPRYTCHRTFDGEDPKCRKVCKTPEDCTGIGNGDSFMCAKEPYWATYGVCVVMDGGK